ncbi:MAG: sensor histidine kinase [Lachnospiraceae bacterium]
MQNKNTSSQKITAAKTAMLFINIAAVLFVSLLISVTTKKICTQFIARDFLDGVNALPSNPAHLVLYCVLLLISLIISFCVRETRGRTNNRILFVTFICDMIIGIFIVYLLNFNYNGIILLIFADIVTYAKDEKGKFVLMFMAIGIFLVADYELISISWRLFSVYSYMNYYESAVQQYLLGIYNVMISMNIASFIIYSVCVIQGQRGTIHEVNMLYDKLSEANQSLQKANTQLQDYAMITEKMGETKERNRLAREIHDTLGHLLTGISAGLDGCIATVLKSPEDTKQQLEVISDVAREGIRDVRRSVNELRPDSMERLGLEYAVTKMITDINSLTQTKIYLDASVSRLKYDEDEENAIYRVIQESITNSIRHGNASEIRVIMKEECSELIILIQDNGTGCSEIKKGFGTKHMQERIKMLDGTISFDGSAGFKVEARIPIRWGEEYD